MKKTVAYFSGSGNTYYAAKKIAEGIGAELMAIPDILADPDSFEIPEVLGIVFPTYMFSPAGPAVTFVEEIFGKRDMSEMQYLFLVATYGITPVGSPKKLENFISRTGCASSYAAAVKFPETFIPLKKIPSEDKIEAIYRAADKTLERIIADLNAEKLKPAGRTILRHINSIHAVMNVAKDSAKKFETVSSKCVLCGDCVRGCPTGNIKIESGKVVFGDNCVACWGCYHRCPQKAIRRKGQKDSRGRLGTKFSGYRPDYTKR